MKKSIAAVTLVILLLALPMGFGQEKTASENFIFKTEVHVDVLLHLLAHMDIGKDDASLYSEEYIKNISQEKQKLGLKADLKDKMDAMKDVFMSDNGLRYIDFLPFYVVDYDELIKGLRWLATETKEKTQNEALNRFRTRFSTSQKQRDFMSEFSRILDHEYQTFYRDYWEKEQERLAAIKRRFEEFVITNGKKVFSPVMMKEKKSAVVFLCLSMTRYGRGFSSRDRFGAAVKFPEKEEEFLPPFIMAIHEMTHQFSDALVMKAEKMERSQSDTAEGSEGYRIHMASEYGVIYADYLLLQKFLPEYLKDYLIFFWDGPEEEAKDKSPEELLKAFKHGLNCPTNPSASCGLYRHLVIVARMAGPIRNKKAGRIPQRLRLKRTLKRFVRPWRLPENRPRSVRPASCKASNRHLK
jgi:hypothetical protein